MSGQLPLESKPASTNDRIIRLDVVGYKRIKAVSLAFDENDHLIIISGKNAHGKTSKLT